MTLADSAARPGVSAVGGDTTACLAASEVDRLTAGDVCLRANFLYEFAHADTGTRQELRNEFTRLTKEGGLCVMWVRHHWVAVRLGPRVTFHNDTTGVTLSQQRFEVYDSARSLPVERDLRSLARILDLVEPELHTCPQQHRGSLECGLFAAAFVWHLAAGKTIPADSTKVSLRALREFYPDRQRMEEMAELAFRREPEKVTARAQGCGKVESAPRTYRHDPYAPTTRESRREPDRDATGRAPGSNGDVASAGGSPGGNTPEIVDIEEGPEDALAHAQAVD